MERAVAEAGRRWLKVGDTTRARQALQRAAWGFEGLGQHELHDRANAMLSSLTDDGGPSFFADVADHLTNCPDWLLE